MFDQPPRRGRRRAWGFWGMVVLIGLIEVGVARRHELVDPIAMQWRYRAKTIPARARRAEVICLGDSLVKYGVDAPVLEQKLGRGVNNHAVLAAPAAASYFALRAAVDAGAKPRLVVVDFVPFLLRSGYRLNRSYLPELGTLGACLDVAWTENDPDLAGNLALGWFLPTIRARLGLRAWISEHVAGISPRPLTRIRRRDLWLPGNNEAVFDWFYTDSWEAGAEHQHYMDRLIDLAKGQGATVVWLMPPISRMIADEWDQLGLSARYTRFAASVQARYPNLVVLDARAIPVTDADLLDPLHLNKPAAERFTARVAEFLAADRVTLGPRWISLPAVPLGVAPPLIQTASVVQ